MKTELISDRLLLRPLKIGDAPFIVELFNSETWLRFIGDRGIKTVQDAENFLTNNSLRFFNDNGWGTYLVALRSDGSSIGTVGLYERQQLDFPDFGYALLPEYAGFGYATEASIAFLDEVAESLDLSKLLAIVQDDNPRSHRVLEKLGFLPDGRVMMEKEVQKWSKNISLNA